MTQLAIIRAFSPYLLRSPKMVDSLLYSAYRYHSKTYDFLLLYSSNISDSVAHLCLILFAIRARPSQWAISCQIARLIVAQAWPGVDWSGVEWSGMECARTIWIWIWIWIERLQNLFVICRCSFGLLVQLWGIIDAVIVVNQSTLWHLWQLK